MKKTFLAIECYNKAVGIERKNGNPIVIYSMHKSQQAGVYEELLNDLEAYCEEIVACLESKDGIKSIRDKKTNKITAYTKDLDKGNLSEIIYASSEEQSEKLKKIYESNGFVIFNTVRELN